MSKEHIDKIFDEIEEENPELVSLGKDCILFGDCKEEYLEEIPEFGRQTRDLLEEDPED